MQDIEVGRWVTWSAKVGRGASMGNASRGRIAVCMEC